MGETAAAHFVRRLLRSLSLLLPAQPLPGEPASAGGKHSHPRTGAAAPAAGLGAGDPWAVALALNIPQNSPQNNPDLLESGDPRVLLPPLGSGGRCSRGEV